MKPDSKQEYKQVDKFIVTSTLLGKGSFGVVYRGFFKDDHSKIVAAKVIPIDRISSDPKFLELLKREIDIMQKIEHPNIVRMYAATRTSRNLYMFLEYCRDGDLKDLLKKNQGVLSESEAVVYFRQIVEGFKILYAQNIIHRDIKPANILLHEGTAKITDFGFARMVETGMEAQNAFSMVGTPLYMPPQILNNEKFSSKCDIWSLGMMLYEMLYGKTPWTANSPSQLYANIKKIPLDFPSKPVRSSLIKDLLRGMLVLEDKDRISWTEIFNHQIIKFDAASLQKNIAQIEGEKDTLLKSVALNKLYVQSNKVMGLKKNSEVAQVFHNKKLDEVKAKDEKVVYDESDYQKVLEKQDQEQVARKIVIKIDSHISFERNIAIFVNYSSTLFFNFYNKLSKKINLSELTFFKVFFLFQKYQIISFKSIIDLMEGKGTNNSEFTVSDWSTYTKSAEYQLTMQAIKNDLEFMLPYFKEVMRRTEDVLKKHSAKEDSAGKAKIKSFETVLNENFVDKVGFKKIYEDTLKEFIEHLKTLFTNEKGAIDKDFLLAIRFAFICFDPYKEFTWNNVDISKSTDFHKFYEHYDNIDEAALQTEVVNLIKPH